MCFQKFNYSYKMGSIIMGLLCVFMGTQMIQTGHQHFGPLVHAYRQMVYPQMKNKISESLTFDEVAKYVIQAHGVLMCLAGVLIIIGNKTYGPLLLIYQMSFVMLLQDNPYLISYIKPAPKSKNYKFGDLARHLSVIGVAVLLLAAPEVKNDEDEEPE